MPVASDVSNETRRRPITSDPVLDQSPRGTQARAPAVFVRTIPPAAGLPPHVHRGADQFVYVLEGTLNIRLGGRRTRLARGMSASLPRGIVHQFDNVADTPAKMLVVVTTGHGPRFLDALAQAHGSLPEEAANAVASLAQRELYVVT